MSGGIRPEGQKSYALDRYPELKEKLEREHPKIVEDIIAKTPEQQKAFDGSCEPCPDRDYWPAADQWECTYTKGKRRSLIGYPHKPKDCPKKRDQNATH
ncbi:MAG: hypothetical protein CVV33_06735 [Methanomicrobiales archaeon HGW-Methanomicrobiales-4]|nr:MAG: hypothetical protein CVV33_06735 [Methanomicrobiales archaeon HGW-Methanomicrobiales-4]